LSVSAMSCLDRFVYGQGDPDIAGSPACRSCPAHPRGPRCRRGGEIVGRETCRRLRLRTALIGVVGDDPEGRQLARIAGVILTRGGTTSRDAAYRPTTPEDASWLAASSVARRWHEGPLRAIDLTTEAESSCRWKMPQRIACLIILSRLCKAAITEERHCRGDCCQDGAHVHPG